MPRILKYSAGLALVLLAGFLQAQTSPEPDAGAVRRFALILGANNGGHGRITLRYALADAKAIRDVLGDIGGVLPEDGVFLDQPNRTDVLNELRSLGDKLDRARPLHRRLEVLFYYSGHSDEESILLGNERITYEELRAAINGLNADVRIAILDSCASGAFTLPKGVKKRFPFLLDTAYDMKGYAFLTSSSADEASQESRRLQGSFFTHNLVSALRGAADHNQDGRITLTEAYQFAFGETLAQTEKTTSGPQHPSYNIQMSGTGDVIITDITKSAGLLTLKEDVSGRFFIHNRANILVAELSKPAGQEITIGLGEGFYRLTAVSDNAVLEAEVTLIKGESQDIGRSRFQRVDKVPTRARGDRTYIPSFGPRGLSRWQVDLFGGIAGTEPDDLNLRAGLDQGLIMAVHDRYSLLRQTGEISFYQADFGEELRPLRLSVAWGFRVRRTIAGGFALSLGLSGLSGAAVSASQNSFTVIETSGRQYIYRYDIADYALSIQAYVPTFSLHAGFDLFRALRLEARVGAGPLFASCRYRKRTVDAPFSDFGQLLEEPYLGTVEEKGRGTGWSWDGGISAQLAVSRTWSLLLEAGYARRRLDGISGPGERVRNDSTESWHGEWAIKSYLSITPWGYYQNDFPSNFWPGSEAPRRVRDFELDLSGFQLKIGLSLKL